MPHEAVAKEGESEAITLLKKRLSRFETEAGRLHGLNYQPRPNDVAITTTPKAGTTWVQQICHQLRSDGDMTFEEISVVVPWLELAQDQGQDLEAPQWNAQAEADGAPRLFKTHAWADHCPPFARTIVVFRNPQDVLASFYHFFQGWLFEPGTITLDAFANEFWLSRGVPQSRMQNASYFVHLISWYQRRSENGVLVLFYEDLRQNLEQEVRRIARFLSTDQFNYDRPELIAKAVAHSSFEFMKRHESQFDERLSKLARNEACGLPNKAGMSNSKVRLGRVDSGLTDISSDLNDKISQKWNEIVEPVTGCGTYEELRQKLRPELGGGKLTSGKIK